MSLTFNIIALQPLTGKAFRPEGVLPSSKLTIKNTNGALPSPYVFNVTIDGNKRYFEVNQTYPFNTGYFYEVYLEVELENGEICIIDQANEIDNDAAYTVGYTEGFDS